MGARTSFCYPPPMKSALEIAMERFGGAQPSPKLTDEQKNKIHELNNLYQARMAERETFLASRIKAAAAEGNEKEVGELELQLRRDMANFREELEAKKKKIWDGA